MTDMGTVGDLVLKLEPPLRKLARLVSRAELEDILGNCLDDVYEDEDE